MPLDANCSLLKALVLICLTTFSFPLLAAAAPVGICLYADSQDTPSERIQCFEFEKREVTKAETRFFLPAGGSTVITAFRNRGVVLYPSLRTTGPGVLDSLLKTYEAHARQSPATRQYLNPWILKMRNNQAEASKQTEAVAKLPSITLSDGTVLKGCKALKKEGTLVSVRHSDGIRKIEIAELSDVTKKELKLDSIPTVVAAAPKTEVVSTPSTDASEVKNTLPVGQPKALHQSASEELKRVYRAAVQGNAEAQAFLGLCLSHGEDVPMDMPEAAKWLKISAEQGYAPGQLALGYLLLKDDGGFTDYVEANKWFLKATEQGNAQAAFTLGQSYSAGQGVAENANVAAKWYKKAAEQGFRDAQVVLGSCYFTGDGVPKDSVLGYMWFDIADVSNSGYGIAQNKLKQEVLQMTSEQIAKAKQLSLEWKSKQTTAIADSDLSSETPPAIQEESSTDSIPSGVSEQVKANRKAAEQGDAKAQLALGVFYEEDRSVPENAAEAVKWYRRAADQGDNEAQWRLGMCYALGKGGLPIDDFQAYVWFSISAIGGDAKTMTALKSALHLTDEQLAKAKQIVKDWKPVHSMPGVIKGRQSLPSSKPDAGSSQPRGSAQPVPRTPSKGGLRAADGLQTSHGL